MTFDGAGHLRRGLQAARWASADLWVATVALGGRLDASDVASITSGRRPPTPAEYDLLAVALNECLDDRGQDHPIPYWSDIAP